jgi:hypothetical protein
LVDRRFYQTSRECLKASSRNVFKLTSSHISLFFTSTTSFSTLKLETHRIHPKCSGCVGPGKKTYGHPPVMTNPGLTPGQPKAITGRAKALVYHSTNPIKGCCNPLFIRRLLFLLQELHFSRTLHLQDQD